MKRFLWMLYGAWTLVLLNFCTKVSIVHNALGYTLMLLVVWMVIYNKEIREFIIKKIKTTENST